MKIIDYIDTEKTTIAILKAYRDQSWKLETASERIQEVDAKITSSTAKYGKAPITGSGGNSVEQAWTDGIAKKAVIEKGVEDALSYHAELKPAWNRLTDDERYMLTVRFIDYEERNGIQKIMERFHIGQSEAYERSRKALSRLARMLWW